MEENEKIYFFEKPIKIFFSLTIPSTNNILLKGKFTTFLVLIFSNLLIFWTI